MSTPPLARGPKRLKVKKPRQNFFKKKIPEAHLAFHRIREARTGLNLGNVDGNGTVGKGRERERELWEP